MACEPEGAAVMHADTEDKTTDEGVGSSAARSASDDADAPVYIDEYFRKKPKKSGREGAIVDAPCMFVPVADTHAHLDMLAYPALALARAGVHKVGFVETMVDPLGDGGITTFSALDGWIREANLLIRQMATRICGQGWNSVPKVRISVGVHPHEAKSYTPEIETQLIDLLHDVRVSAVGEIGLDYHYDFSPRDVQRRVFARQVEIAHVAGLPVILHVREAFDDAWHIMEEVGWPEAGTLLHCYTSDASEIARWVDAGCFIAFGGALTFKKLEEIREASKLVPMNRLLTETDAPFMTPEPFRGMECEPAHVIWTADRLFGVRKEDGLVADQREFMTQMYENALGLLNSEPTAWQLDGGDEALREEE